MRGVSEWGERGVSGYWALARGRAGSNWVRGVSEGGSKWVRGVSEWGGGVSG